MNGLEELAFDMVWVQTAIGIIGMFLIALLAVVAYMRKLEHKEEMMRLEGQKEARLYWVYDEKQVKTRTN